MAKFSAAVIALMLSAGSVQADPIHDAAGAGNIEEVRRLISAGADVNEMDRIAGTPLHRAAVKGRLEVAEILISKGAEINAPAGLSQGTPLHMAALGNHSDLVALLLSKGADVNARDGRGNTPLHMAAAGGDIATVKLLIDSDADLFARNRDGEPPIRTAGKTDHFDIVDLLIAHGVTPPKVEPVTELLRDADPEIGHLVFTAICEHCHSIDKGGPIRHGPNLWGILERGKARSLDFSHYSPALSRLDGMWSYEDLNAFLADPEEAVPGTLMVVPDLKDPPQRAALIAYFRENGDAPPPLPE